MTTTSDWLAFDRKRYAEHLACEQAIEAACYAAVLDLSRVHKMTVRQYLGAPGICPSCDEEAVVGRRILADGRCLCVCRACYFVCFIGRLEYMGSSPVREDRLPPTKRPFQRKRSP